jgi:DNA polymerase-1
MIEIDALLRNSKDAYQLLQVHDELVFEIKKGKVAEYAPKIKKIMENALPEDKRRGVPIIAEGKQGPTWGEMEKIDA